MSNNSIAIVDQIENRVRIKVIFPDTYPAICSIIEQDDKFWFGPAFHDYRQIPAEIVTDLKNQFTGEQKFNTDPEIIRTGMDHDDFMDKYYNQY